MKLSNNELASFSKARSGRALHRSQLASGAELADSDAHQMQASTATQRNMIGIMSSAPIGACDAVLDGSVDESVPDTVSFDPLRGCIEAILENGGAGQTGSDGRSDMRKAVVGTMASSYAASPVGLWRKLKVEGNSDL